MCIFSVASHQVHGADSPSRLISASVLLTSLLVKLRQQNVTDNVCILHWNGHFYASQAHVYVQTNSSVVKKLNFMSTGFLIWIKFAVINTYNCKICCWRKMLSLNFTKHKQFKSNWRCLSYIILHCSYFHHLMCQTSLL